MQLWHTALQLCLLASATIPTAAASSWGFTDATVSVQTKGAGVGFGLKEKYSHSFIDSLFKKLIC
jgi:oligosaccharyltransferase complex subunit delta (ribophorin II)